MAEESQFRAVAGAARRPRPIATARRLAAETIGTFWLVLGGCGTAVLAAGTSVPGSIGLVGVSLAFGLTVFTMAFAVGFISSRHFTPAVSLGLTIGDTPVELFVGDGRTPVEVRTQGGRA